MAHQVKIPAAGESINSATVGQWHKADGETVQKGDLLATIETDKVSTELEAEVAGVLKIVVEEGEEVAIGTVVAEIEEDADASSSPAPPEKQDGGSSHAAAGDNAEPSAESRPAAPSQSASSGASKSEESEVIEIKVPAAGESITSASIAEWHKRDGEIVREGENLVTLDTDKVSTELDAEADGVLAIHSPEGSEVSIGAVIGTITTGAQAESRANRSPSTESDRAGQGDRKAQESSPTPDHAVEGRESTAPTRRTTETAAAQLPDLSRTPSASRGSTTRSESVSDGRTTRKRMSPLRRKIAAQLVNAQHTAAILTTFNEVDMSAVMKLRKSVQESFVEKYGVKLGFMSLFTKAVVHALKEVPSVNGRIDGDEIIENHFYDIGIAVGTDKGLFVPVVRDVDKKSCAEIERDIADYATRAKDGKITLEDLQGGSFTISNGGVYGSLLSTPILNPPQSGILGMHTIQERPVVVDGRIEIRPMMYLALSYDHRLVDGKGAVSFLIDIKKSLESPAALLLEL